MSNKEKKETVNQRLIEKMKAFVSLMAYMALMGIILYSVAFYAAKRYGSFFEREPEIIVSALPLRTFPFFPGIEIASKGLLFTKSQETAEVNDMLFEISLVDCTLGAMFIIVGGFVVFVAFPYIKLDYVMMAESYKWILIEKVKGFWYSLKEPKTVAIYNRGAMEFKEKYATEIEDYITKVKEHAMLISKQKELLAQEAIKDEIARIFSEYILMGSFFFLIVLGTMLVIEFYVKIRMDRKEE